MTGTKEIPALGMTTSEFRQRGKQLIDWIADYFENIEGYSVRSSVSPGYLAAMLPTTAPDEPEQWDDVMKDFVKCIVPGMTHWQSPRFHAYLPALTSFPSILGEMLSNTFSAIGFSWINSPAMTELETIVMDWSASMFGLPAKFLSSTNGGGVIQTTCSDSTLVVVIVARENACTGDNAVALANTSAYVTSFRHASFDKAFKVAGIAHMRVVSSPAEFEANILADLSKGIRPIFIGCTLGTTATMDNDPLDLYGPICARHNIYLHVDAAYAGTACICPENRSMLKGIEFADSFCTNLHKNMLVNFDCSALFVVDRNALQAAMATDMEIYKNEATSSGRVFDLKNWQIALGRRFRALKVWFVLRSFGVRGLQEHIRKQCRLALEFDQLVRADDQFEIVSPTTLGLVCFRLIGSNEREGINDLNALNRALLNALNADGTIFVVHSTVNGNLFIRFAVCSPMTESSHIESDWSCIQRVAKTVIARKY